MPSLTTSDVRIFFLRIALTLYKPIAQPCYPNFAIVGRHNDKIVDKDGRADDGPLGFQSPF